MCALQVTELLTDTLDPDQLRDLVQPPKRQQQQQQHVWGPYAPGDGGVEGGAAGEWGHIKSRSVLGDFSPLSSRHSLQWDRNKDRLRERESVTPTRGHLGTSQEAAEDWREEILFCMLDYFQTLASSDTDSNLSGFQDLILSTQPASLAGRLRRYSNRLAVIAPSVAAKKNDQFAFRVLFSKLQRAPWVQGPSDRSLSLRESVRESAEMKRSLSLSLPTPYTKGLDLLLRATDATTTYDYRQILVGQDEGQGQAKGRYSGEDVTLPLTPVLSQTISTTTSPTLSDIYLPTSYTDPSQMSPRDSTSNISTYPYRIDLNNPFFNTATMNPFQVNLRPSGKDSSTAVRSDSILEEDHRALRISSIEAHMSGVSMPAVDCFYPDDSVFMRKVRGGSASSTTAEHSSLSSEHRPVAVQSSKVDILCDPEEAIYAPYLSGAMEREEFLGTNPNLPRKRLDWSIRSAVNTLGGGGGEGGGGGAERGSDVIHRDVILREKAEACGEAKSHTDQTDLGASKYAAPVSVSLSLSVRSSAIEKRDAEHPVHGATSGDRSPLNESSATQFWLLSDSDSECDDGLGSLYGDAESTCLFDDSS